MSPWVQMLADALDNIAALIAFFCVVLGSVVILCVLALFGALAIRGAWRWITGHSWNSAIAAAERKAFNAHR